MRITNYALRIVTAFAAVIILLASSSVTLAAENLKIGEGFYQFESSGGINKNPIDVFYYRPKNWKNGDKIFVVFHGMDRRIDYYIKGLKKAADKKNILLICPQFTREKFPGNKYYNYGNAASNDKNQQTYNIANKIIDDAKKRFGATKSKIIFFGHSAGGQFMHRYLFLADKIKADLVIAANAGTYLLPDENVNYPYGFKNISAGKKEMKRAYSQKTIILLGEKDISRTSKGLPKSRMDDKQGLNRFERGKNFFDQSKKKAEELGTKFNWQLKTVPNVAHNAVRMARAALKYVD